MVCPGALGATLKSYRDKKQSPSVCSLFPVKTATERPSSDIFHILRCLQRCYHSTAKLFRAYFSDFASRWSSWQPADQPTACPSKRTWGLLKKSMQEIRVNRRVMGWSAGRHVYHPCGWQILSWPARKSHCNKHEGYRSIMVRYLVKFKERGL